MPLAPTSTYLDLVVKRLYTGPGQYDVEFDVDARAALFVVVNAEVQGHFDSYKDTKLSA